MEQLRGLILASSSPRRQELLAQLGCTFTVIKPDIDETQHPSESPLAYVTRLSQQKAQAVAEKLASPQAVLSADTVVILSADTIGITDEGAILGKPATPEEARTMLEQLRDRAHIVCTAFTLWDEGVFYTTPVQTRVLMRRYSDEEIQAYVASGDPFDKAGGYAIQHEGFHPVASIEGSYTNVMGLPIEAVQAVLMARGVLVAQ